LDAVRVIALCRHYAEIQEIDVRVVDQDDGGA
jgi:hypothetical protein